MKNTLKILMVVGFIFIGFFLVYQLVLSWKELNSLTFNIKFSRLFEAISGFYVADLDGNSVEDLVAVSSVEPYPRKNILKSFCPFHRPGLGEVTYFSENLILLKQGVIQPLDLDGDGRFEIPLVELEGHKDLILRTKNIKGNDKDIYHFPLVKWEGYSSLEIAFDDLDADGWLEMLVVFHNYWNEEPRRPRVILAYNIQQRRLLWEFPMGCDPLIVRTVDINNDGNKEIIVSGWAAHNGVAANGTDDDHSYIIVLSHEGKELWKRDVGGYYTKVYIDVGDVDKDGELEIISGKSCHRELEPDLAELNIFDAATGRVESHYSKNYDFLTSVQLRQREGREAVILTGDSTGKVSLFDKKLRLLKAIQLEYPAIVLGVAKMGRRPQREYVFVQAGFTNLYILTPTLKKINRTTFNNQKGDKVFIMRPIRNGDEGAVALLVDALYLARMERQSLPSFLAALLRARFTVFLLIFLSLNGLLVYILAVRPKHLVIRKQGEGMTDVIQEIAHRMKSPLFTIQLEAERLQSALGDADSPKSILDDVSNLKGKIRSLMKILELREPRLRNTDLNMLVSRIVRRYSGLLKKRVVFELDLDEDQFLIPLDEEQMEEALSNIIENSIDILAEGGKVRIATTCVYSSIVRTKKGIEVEIEDNGQGIPEDKLPLIFNPYFTTKKDGSGLGLTIARRIIEAHGGRVEVQSKSGVGTRFAVFLPVKSGKGSKKLG